MANQSDMQLPVTPRHTETPTDQFLHRSNERKDFSDLNNDELQVLVTLAINALKDRGITFHPSVPVAPRVPDIFDNAKFEQISCAGLQPKYNGSPDELIPTLNAIHIRRQNEVWYSATFLVQQGASVDLIRNFSQITQDTVQAKAKELWDDPNSIITRHTRGTETYNSRLLALFLMNSLTSEFAALIHSRIDPKYSTDGPTLLFTMCFHIHRNHLAFIESIKNKIRLSTLQEFKNDVPSFLRFLQDNLRLITSTGASDTAHNDLIPHILLQLRTTTIPLFQQSVLKWQRNYMENSLTLTPSTLVSMADEECQVLKHSCQWVETIDPSVAAMQAMFQTNKEGSAKFFQTLAANFTELSKKQREFNKSYNNNRDDRYGSNNNPDWLYDPPTDINESRTFRGRQWNFCTKCGRNGKWVCTHTNESHRQPSHFEDDYRRSPRNTGRDSRYYDDAHNNCNHYTPRYQVNRHDRDHLDRDSRSRSPLRSQSRSRSPAPRQERSVSFRPPTPKSPSASLSLFDSIADFMRGT
jgi:hypothetical protein